MAETIKPQFEPQFELVSMCAIVDIFILVTVVYQRLEEKTRIADTINEVTVLKEASASR